MPLARGIRVQVVHIFCSPGGLASQPLLKKANHRDEADDAESQEGYHDDGRPPHVDHLNLTIYLTFPEQKAAHRVVDHTWSNEVACRPLTQLGHLAANCLRSRELTPRRGCPPVCHIRAMTGGEPRSARHPLLHPVSADHPELPGTGDPARQVQRLGRPQCRGPGELWLMAIGMGPQRAPGFPLTCAAVHRVPIAVTAPNGTTARAPTADECYGMCDCFEARAT